MTILEMHSQEGSTVRWSEVCGPQHHSASVVPRAGGIAAEYIPAGSARTRRLPQSRVRPINRVERRSLVPVAGPRSAHARPARQLSAGPDRRVPGGAVTRDRIRACHVDTGAAVRMTDDVPTWVLLTCGVVLGVILLLALAFIGGPTYA